MLCQNNSYWKGGFSARWKDKTSSHPWDTHQYPTEIVKLHMSSANAFRPPKNALCWKLAIEFFEKSMGCKNPEKKIYKEP
jgi:hypothetical protein